MGPLRDLTEWIVFSLALVLACFAVFDTHRVVRLLSYGRKNLEPSIGQIWALRIPGAMVIAGIIGKMWITMHGKP